MLEYQRTRNSGCEFLVSPTMEPAATNSNASQEPSITPQSLITEKNVKRVLLTDKGKGATLKSWKVVDFTNKGDNYACVVTSVEADFVIGEKEQCVTYIVKLNPCRSSMGLEMTNLTFAKEAKFYLELLPNINAVLEEAGKERIRMARCFLGHLEIGEEQIFFEDLRATGFKMFDRRKGMDRDHAILVLKELARLHAGSHILQSKTPEEPLEVKYDFLTVSEVARTLIFPMLKGTLKTSIDMLKKIGGYERAITWVECLDSRLERLLSFEIIQSKKMGCVNHGDCWNNNILFRYNCEGKPVDVRLLDLQMCKKASVSVDLNYFLFTSLTGAVRQPNLKSFLSTYYASYKDILSAEGFEMHFTKEELREEFRNMNSYGALFAMMIIPLVLVESAKAPYLPGISDEFVKKMDNFTSLGLEMLDTNPLLKPRFLAMFDELMENGTIP